MKIVFREEQKFTQIWLWVILISIAIIPIWGIYQQLMLGEAFGNNPMSDFGLILLCLFVFGLIAMFLFVKLKTEIDSNEIRMHFSPFVRKKISWKNIKSAEIVNYGFVGGWGIRLWTKYGTVYNTKGNKGLAIQLLNGKKLLIGTQKATELNRFLKKLVGMSFNHLGYNALMIY